MAKSPIQVAIGPGGLSPEASQHLLLVNSTDARVRHASHVETALNAKEKSKTPGPRRRSKSDLPLHAVPDVLPQKKPASSHGWKALRRRKLTAGVHQLPYLSRTQAKSGSTFCQFVGIYSCETCKSFRDKFLRFYVWQKNNSG